MAAASNSCPAARFRLEVPANAEIVIEGYVDPKEKLMEGPFGDHTGFYSLADWYPAFYVTAITHRKNPIYPTTIVGKPPMEDYFLGKATERIFLPLAANHRAGHRWITACRSAAFFTTVPS